VYTHIQIQYLFSGHDLDPKAIERAIQLSQDTYCSVSAMLGKTAVIEHTYEILTDIPEPA
jgi:putative redox protein